MKRKFSIQKKENRGWIYNAPPKRLEPIINEIASVNVYQGLISILQVDHQNVLIR